MVLVDLHGSGDLLHLQSHVDPHGSSVVEMNYLRASARAAFSKYAL